jgi:hypothetical protein
MDYLESDQDSMQPCMLERLAHDRQLVAYRYKGF